MFWSPLTSFLKEAWKTLWGGLASFWTSGRPSTRNRSISDDFELHPLRPVRVPNSRMTQSLPTPRWDPETLGRRYGDWKDDTVLVRMYR